MITINGKKADFKPNTTITSLLSELGLGEKPVVVELNRKALSPSEFAGQVIQDGDKIEIITIAAGG